MTSSVKLSDNDYIGFDGKFKTDARSQEKEGGKSTVANFYVEDGSQVSDHIIIDARTLTVSGEVSDVFYQREILTNNYAKSVDELGNIAIYLPSTTNSQKSVINKYVNQFEDLKRKVDDVESKVTQFGEYVADVTGNDTLKNFITKEGKSTKSVQAEFIKFIRTYHILKKTMRIETNRYGIFKKMAIVNYSFSKNEDDYTTYSIDFQEIREVKTLLTPVKQLAKNVGGTQSKIQTSDKQDKGVIQGTEKSLATKIKDLF